MLLSAAATQTINKANNWPTKSFKYKLKKTKNKLQLKNSNSIAIKTLIKLRRKTKIPSSPQKKINNVTTNVIFIIKNIVIINIIIKIKNTAEEENRTPALRYDKPIFYH